MVWLKCSQSVLLIVKRWVNLQHFQHICNLIYQHICNLGHISRCPYGVMPMPYVHYISFRSNQLRMARKQKELNRYNHSVFVVYSETQMQMRMVHFVLHKEENIVKCDSDQGNQGNFPSSGELDRFEWQKQCTFSTKREIRIDDFISYVVESIEITVYFTFTVSDDGFNRVCVQFAPSLW